MLRNHMLNVYLCVCGDSNEKLIRIKETEKAYLLAISLLTGLET